MAFDSEYLMVNPAVIALGGADDLSVVLESASDTPRGPACQAALAGYRTALMFRVLFAALVFVVGVASTAALVIAVIQIIADDADVAALVTGVGGLLGSAATAFLVKRMNESINVARQALKDVGTYCGSTIQEKVK